MWDLLISIRLKLTELLSGGDGACGCRASIQVHEWNSQQLGEGKSRPEQARSVCHTGYDQKSMHNEGSLAQKKLAEAADC